MDLARVEDLQRRRGDAEWPHDRRGMVFEYCPPRARRGESGPPPDTVLRPLPPPTGEEEEEEDPFLSVSRRRSLRQGSREPRVSSQLGPSSEREHMRVRARLVVDEPGPI
ncbi:unnamed protein product [Prorocentrum cordatum]|uniref:Uncharacterized protein n=1 Tax=Prorocentrum cordatum TaxID=2364126 RepID=A0ABN9S8I3_9DINO|nr:unnamed protein product [Polarella glacialis]